MFILFVCGRAVWTADNVKMTAADGEDEALPATYQLITTRSSRQERRAPPTGGRL